VKKSYRIVIHKDSRSLTQHPTCTGQFLLPIVKIVETSRIAIDELIYILGRASIEVVF